MVAISNVTLAGQITGPDAARLTVKWRSAFNTRETAARSAFVYDIVIDNVDGLGDLDDRRRRLGSAFAVASQESVNLEKSFKVDRRFLDEDPRVLALFETTDEWRAEVIAKPFIPSGDSAASPQLRQEFGFDGP